MNEHRDQDPASTDGPVEPMPEEPKLPPIWTRLIDTVLSPGKMGDYVAAKPKWFAALGVAAVLVALQTAVIPTDIMLEAQRQAQLDAGGDVQEMPAAAMTILRIVMPLFAVVSVFVFTAIFAGLYTFVYAFILGDEGRFTQYFAILAHASFIPALAGLALVPLRISTRNPQATLNLGNFFFFLEDGYLLGVLTALDLTQLWVAAIVAVGATRIDPRRSLGSALAVPLFFTLALALVFGRFL